MKYAFKFRQIEAFKAVMESGTVTAAANQLSLTQPAVSKLVANLEYSVGLKLFERTKGRLKPTPEAEVLYEHVSRTFSMLEGLLLVANEIKSLKRGKITVASLPMLGNSWLPRMCVKFASNRDDVGFTLETRSSMKILDWTATGHIDVGIGMMHEDARVNADILANIEVVCVLPIGHKLAKKSIIEPKDFNGESFVLTGLMDGTRSKIDAMFKTHEVEINPQFDTNVASTTCNIVAAGAGISMVNALSASEFKHLGFEIRRFRPELQFEIYLVTPKHKPQSKLVKSFCDLLKQHAVEDLNGLAERLGLSAT